MGFVGVCDICGVNDWVNYLYDQYQIRDVKHICENCDDEIRVYKDDLMKKLLSEMSQKVRSKIGQIKGKT